MKLSFALSAMLTVIVLSCGSQSENSASQVSDTAPVTCSIKTHFNRYLTAVGGGGRNYEALHADATQVGAWEKFTLVDSGDGAANIHYGIRTSNGHYLTAVGAGGRITDVIHSDATELRGWEKFTFNSLGGGIYNIQTANGHYLGHAGQNPDVLHSDATVAQSWEQFQVNCGI